MYHCCFAGFSLLLPALSQRESPTLVVQATSLAERSPASESRGAGNSIQSSPVLYSPTKAGVDDQVTHHELRQSFKSDIGNMKMFLDEVGLHHGYTFVNTQKAKRESSNPP